MANPLSAMLDELMGRHRNALPSERQRDTRWDDKEVCPYFVAGYCPHELFTNTKADLGLCDRIHDEKLRLQYRKSSRFEQVGVEDEFLRYLQKVDSDMRKKINRNKQRLDLTQPGGETSNVNKEKIEDKITQLTEKITALLTQAEQLGAEGKVDESQNVVAMMEELKEERDRCRKTLDTPAGELKLMEVCETCGCFLILGDSQHRLDEHLTGKQHTGFAKIRATIEELIRRKEEKRKERDEELRKLRDGRRTSRDQVADRSDKHRDKDKDKEKVKDKDKDKEKVENEKKISSTSGHHSSSKRSHKDHDSSRHSHAHHHHGASDRDKSSKSRHRSRSNSRSKNPKSSTSRSDKSKSHDKPSADKHSHGSKRSHKDKEDKKDNSENKRVKRETSPPLIEKTETPVIEPPISVDSMQLDQQVIDDEDFGCETEEVKYSSSANCEEVGGKNVEERNGQSESIVSSERNDEQTVD